MELGRTRGGAARCWRLAGGGWEHKEATKTADGVRLVQHTERSLTPSWGIPGVEWAGEIGSVRA